MVERLLERYGETYAAEAGIRLTDKPSPLYQLLVLANLLSARISGEIAVAAARELFKAGYRTPRAMRAASWQERVDALGRGHYRRYDERTATMLGEGAEILDERWAGDLRKLREEAGDTPEALVELLTEFPGIGPAGAAIFLREVQAVWTPLVPFLDQPALAAAREVGLPGDARKLAKLVPEPEDFVRLASALIRVTRDKKGVDALKS